MPKVLIYVVSLFGTYILLNKFSFKSILAARKTYLRNTFSEKQQDIISYSIVAFILITFIIHHIYLGGIPILDAMHVNNNTESAQLRRSITSEAPRILNYIVSFNLRAFIPFMILLFFIKKKKGLYLLLILLGSFYSFSLMQKSYVVCIMSPVFLYAIFEKKYLHTLLHLFLIGLVIYGQFIVANPRANIEANPIPTEEILQENKNGFNAQDSLLNSTPEVIAEEPTIEDKFKPSSKVFSGLYHGLVYRLAMVPGKTASQWFDIVPAQKPFLYGDGYRWLAAIKGNTYHNYFLELYPIMYPRYAARGLKGSVNTASFVVDYSNFGKLGLILAGIILALFLTIVEALFWDDFKLKFSLNLYPVLIISSTMLTTTLLTGGWGFLLAMYFIFLSKKKELN